MTKKNNTKNETDDDSGCALSISSNAANQLQNKTPRLTYIPSHVINNGYTSSITDINKVIESDPTISTLSSPTMSAVRSKTKLVSFAAVSNQKFSIAQRLKLATFTSVNYSPSNSAVYREWLAKNKHLFGFDRLILMIFSGLLIGLIAGFLSQCLTALADFKWTKSKEFSQKNDLWMCFIWTSSISVILVTVSSVSVAFGYPPAMGSGTAEVISYLNGIIVHGTFGFRNLIVKFIALVFAVSSGLPCAIQGPIIAMGANVGYCVSQFKSKTFGFDFKWFARFRNPEDRRTFTTAGVAAGVAAAFNAPIGGLLFAMEDISSFWSRRLCWQTFFCCGISSAMANVINTALKGFKNNGNFGLLGYKPAQPVQLHASILLVSIVLGIVGGILGALYTTINVKIIKTRNWFYQTCISNVTVQKFIKVMETILIALVMSTYVIWFPTLFTCREYTISNYTASNTGDCQVEEKNHLNVSQFNCEFLKGENTTGIYYNEAATLLQRSGSSLWELLIVRFEYRRFKWDHLLMVWPIYFIMTAWTSGSAIAGGIFLPTLISGAMYGRAAGLGILELYTYLFGYSNPHVGESVLWHWLDPGIIALIGAGSLLAGVQRLTLAITVIIVEMSGDITLTVPLLLANSLAKYVADYFTLPLYRHLLNIKAMPYLEEEPRIKIGGRERDMDLHYASEIMQKPVKVLHAIESIGSLAQLLMDTEHGAFPVVKFSSSADDEPQFFGIITRVELMVILSDDQIYNIDEPGTVITPHIDYPDLSVDYINDKSFALERIRTYGKFQQYSNIYINLECFTNASAPKICETYSIHRTYSLFRTLGLRHLVVTDLYNHVVGIITRKDLLPFNVEEKINASELNNSTSWNEMLESTDLILPATTVKGIPPIIINSDDDVKVRQNKSKISNTTCETPI